MQITQRLRNEIQEKLKSEENTAVVNILCNEAGFLIESQACKINIRPISENKCFKIKSVCVTFVRNVLKIVNHVLNAVFYDLTRIYHNLKSIITLKITPFLYCKPQHYENLCNIKV